MPSCRRLWQLRTEGIAYTWRFGYIEINMATIGRTSASVVGIPLVTAVALVEDGASFICTPQLLRVVSHLLSSTFFAWMVDDTAGLDIGFGNGLHLRPLCPQRRRKGGRLRNCNDRLG
jgi:hypothetical protein